MSGGSDRSPELDSRIGFRISRPSLENKVMPTLPHTNIPAGWLETTLAEDGEA